MDSAPSPPYLCRFHSVPFPSIYRFFFLVSLGVNAALGGWRLGRGCRLGLLTAANGKEREGKVGEGMGGSAVAILGLQTAEACDSSAIRR